MEQADTTLSRQYGDKLKDYSWRNFFWTNDMLAIIYDMLAIIYDIISSYIFSYYV